MNPIEQYFWLCAMYPGRTTLIVFLIGVALGGDPMNNPARNEVERLLIMLVQTRMHLDDAEPNVGFGPFVEHVLGDVMKDASVALPLERVAVLRRYLRHWRDKDRP